MAGNELVPQHPDGPPREFAIESIEADRLPAPPVVKLLAKLRDFQHDVDARYDLRIAPVGSCIEWMEQGRRWRLLKKISAAVD